MRINKILQIIEIIETSYKLIFTSRIETQIPSICLPTAIFFLYDNVLKSVKNTCKFVLKCSQVEFSFFYWFKYSVISGDVNKMEFAYLFAILLNETKDDQLLQTLLI